MKKEDFIYLWVSIYLRNSIQAMIAVESYCNGTVVDFYEDLYESFNKTLEVYETLLASEIEQTKMQAIMEAYITRCKNEHNERFLNSVEEIINNKSMVSSYNIRERFREISEGDSINPFLAVIKEIRLLEEK